MSIEPSSAPQPRGKSPMKVLARGHMNGNDVVQAANLHAALLSIMTELASLNRDLDEAAVFRVFQAKFEESGFFTQDHALVLVLAALSAAGAPCEDLAKIAATHKKQEKSAGIFGTLFKQNVQLLSPSLFTLYSKVKKGETATAEMSLARHAPVTAPQQAFNARAREVLSGEATPRAATPTPESDDNTGHHDMQGSLEVRPTQTLDDILHILTHAPQHQEAELVKNYLDRISFSTEQALMLISALNDSTHINLAEVTRNPVWNFLWDVRKKLWERNDLQSHLFPERF